MAFQVKYRHFLKLCTGANRSVITNVHRHNTVQLYGSQKNVSVISTPRSFADQNFAQAKGGTFSLGNAFNQMDSDVRRFGRISLEDVNQIFNEIKSNKTASPTQSLLLLRCCGTILPEESAKDRRKLVDKIWITFKQLGVPMDVSHYNALLRVHLENDHMFSPTSFLADMEKNKIEPNRVTFQRLIAKYCQEGNIEGATKILEFMKQKSLPINESVFSSLILGHARDGDMGSAEGMLDIMKQSSLEPSSESFSMLAQGYAEQGQTDGLLKTLERWSKADVSIHNRDLMNLVYALSVKGQLALLPEIMGRMRRESSYNQDCYNMVCRLVNVGRDDAAYLVLKAMIPSANKEGEQAPSGSFFIRQLLKSRMSVEKILFHCNNMRNDGLHPLSISIALHFALMFGNTETALALIRVMREEQQELRPHYFWPIFCHHGKSGNITKIYETLNEMLKLEVHVNLQTLRTYVVPLLLKSGEKIEDIICNLSQTGIESLSLIVNSCLAHYLDENNVIEGLNILKAHPHSVYRMQRNSLKEAFIASREAAGTAVILGQMTLSFNDSLSEATERQPEGNEIAKSHFAGDFLIDVANALKGLQEMDEVMLPLLLEMEKYGINISEEKSSILLSLFGAPSQEMVSILGRLCAGIMTYVPLPRTVAQRKGSNFITLERRMQQFESENQTVPTGLLVSLLNMYISAGNVTKAMEIKMKLEAEKFTFWTGFLVRIMNMHVEVGQLTDALSCLTEISSISVGAKVNPVKILKLARLMMKNGQLEATVKLLISYAPDPRVEEEDEEMKYIPLHHCRDLLDISAATGDLETVKMLMNVLVENRYCTLNHVLLGSLITTYLNRDDLPGALQEYERIVRDYKYGPCKRDLTTRCIMLEDTEKLQKVVDLSISVHGEANCLYDLAFAFIGCRKIRQAQKIMETPGLRGKNMKLRSFCLACLHNGDVQALEDLAMVTRDLFDVDRLMLFNFLLRAYKQTGECDKAFGLWTTMQEENVEASELFLHELGSFLTENGLPVPFVMPSQEAVLAVDRDMEEFRTSVDEKNLQQALDLNRKIESRGSHVSINEATNLLTLLLKEQRIGEAFKVTRGMLERGSYPQNSKLALLLAQLIHAGDVENIEWIGEHIDEDVKKSCQYASGLALAYFNSNRHMEYLDKFSKKMEACDPNNFAILNKFIPSKGLLSLLKNHPETLPKVTEIADAMGKLGVTKMQNILWQHHFITKNTAEADKIFDEYFQAMPPSSYLNFRNICQRAIQNNDSEMADSLLKKLKSLINPSEDSIAYVHACRMDILNRAGKSDEVLALLESALKDVPIEKFNPVILNRTKLNVEAANRKFPYTIPERKPRSRMNRNTEHHSTDGDSD